MNEPLKAGDEAIIVSGALGPERCLNRGRQVILVHRIGQDLLLQTATGVENHGQLWRVRTKDGKPLRRIDGMDLRSPVPADQCDCAQSWLQRPDRPPAEGVSEKAEDNLHA